MHTFQIDPTINPKSSRKTGKGMQFIILHAITIHVPLVEINDSTGNPVDIIEWTGDTCHPNANADGKLTVETLCVAQSHTGDYHDNMNSEMFMLWV